MRDDREKRERRSGGHAVGKMIMIMIKNENDDYVDDGEENDDVGDKDNGEDVDNEDIMLMMMKTMTKR